MKSLINASRHFISMFSHFKGYLPNSNLAVEAMLATASIGATWSSTSPDFGVTVSLTDTVLVLITLVAI